MFDCSVSGSLVMWFPEQDHGIGKHLKDAGEFAKLETEVLVKLHEHRNQDAFVDVGANIGTIALNFARQCTSTPVYAYEAQPVIHGLLMTNIITNLLTNVQARHMAIGDFDGETDFPVPSLLAPRNFGATGMDAAVDRNETVLMRKLDTLFPTQTIGTIKIDVEGFESKVLAGAEKVILRDRPSVLFEANPGYTNADNAQWFLDRGYRLFWLHVPNYGFGNYKRAAFDRGLPGDMNLVALPVDRPPPISMPRLNDPAEAAPMGFDEHPYLAPLRG